MKKMIALALCAAAVIAFPTGAEARDHYRGWNGHHRWDRDRGHHYSYRYSRYYPRYAYRYSYPRYRTRTVVVG